MPIQMKEAGSDEFQPVLRAIAEEAGAARRRGDMEEYRRKKAILEAMSRLYRGFGTTEDVLEFERLKQSPLQQIASAGKWVAIGAGALLLLPYLTKVRR